MKIFAFIGASDSGKTQLIRKLVGELKSRDFSVSVIKHCAHGFELEGQGKDTAQFMKAGSDSVCLYSPEGMAVFQQKKTGLDVGSIAGEFLRCSDFILVEGAKSDKKVKKIEVLKAGRPDESMCLPDERLAVVSEDGVERECPVFHPEEIGKIADFLEKSEPEKKSQVQLDIDGVPVPMNPFVQRIFGNTLMGLIKALDGVPKDPGCILLSLISKGKNDEKI
jgi:molybdopterin-guanine dinucleotide biosynthesis protein B